jgi:hypothetical protein
MLLMWWTAAAGLGRVASPESCPHACALVLLLGVPIHDMFLLVELQEQHLLVQQVQVLPSCRCTPRASCELCLPCQSTAAVAMAGRRCFTSSALLLCCPGSISLPAAAHCVPAEATAVLFCCALLVALPSRAWVVGSKSVDLNR